MRCGLLGKKLGHSYSPQIHSYLGSYTYDLFEKTPNELADFLYSGDFSGLNVTIPYKKDVLPFCSELSDCAKKLGAVNTIVKKADGTLIGHNTDYFGFKAMLQKSRLQVSGKKVLVLGSGGASATVTAVLRELNAIVVVISRTGENNYCNLAKNSDASVIVNTTPVGMYPNTGTSPVELDFFPNLEGVLDVVYNPSKTQLLLDAEERGLVTENGLWMLVAQAKESAEWFTGKKISNDTIAEIHTLLQRQMQNIVLIGMPGSGKSTIGKLVAQKLGRTFVDVDLKIEESAGCSIPTIFAQQGEDVFRQYETAALKELGKQSGLVIATGGGCVTRPINYPILHQNSYIVWIKRDITKLPTEGRPLSRRSKLEEMYHVREPMYQSFSDVSVQNDGILSDAVQIVLKEVGY